jgi:hypothetical protein
MASIDFYVHTTGDTNLGILSSGLGFYGTGGFGTSVAVGSWQDSTFVTDGNGLVQGPQVHNCKWESTSGCYCDGVWYELEHDLPNYLSTLNIRFTHTTGVNVQNAELRIYDRSNINNAATGVTTKVVEVIHPELTGSDGSGDALWITPAGSDVVVPMADSPGELGLYAGGTGGVADDRHDWYVAISASPDSIGSKQDFALYFSCEYL